MGTRKAAGACEYGTEPLGFIKREECLHWLRTCELLRKGSVPWSRSVSQSVSLNCHCWQPPP
jgi:hypothetical protein